MKHRPLDAVMALGIFVCLSFFPVQGNAAPYPPFIPVPPSIVAISSSGRYLVGFEYVTPQEELSAEFQQTSQLPVFTYRITLWENAQDTVVEIGNVESETPLLTDVVPIFGVSISPDETALAIREDTQIRILQIPGLEAEATISIPIGQPLLVQSVAWSSDSQYLAFTDEVLALTVWDRQSQEITHSATDVPFDGAITPVAEGWIVQFALFAPVEEDRVFQACDLLLTECQVYRSADSASPFVYSAVRVAPEGEGVLVVAEDGALWWWQRGQGMNYLSPDAPLTALNHSSSEYLPFFSPDGNFLAVPDNAQNDERRLEVYDVELWTPVTSGYPALTAAFAPDKNAILWWDYTENALRAACIGQAESEPISDPALETVIMARFQTDDSSDYLLVENGSAEATMNLLFRVPEMGCR
jgi:hypothetical protein